MAVVNETPPTHHTPTPTSGSGGSGKAGNWFKKNKLLVIGGGGLATILLLGHKGSSAGANTTAQTAADQAYQQGFATGSAQGAVTPGGSTSGGGGAPVDTSGLSAGSSGGSSGNAGASGGSGDTSGDTSGQGGVTGPLISITEQAAAPATKNLHKEHHNPPHHHEPPKPKEPSKTRPAPATQHGNHPATPRKTPHGSRRNSPAVVESPDGKGSGITVMGRDFPGAVAHHLGPPVRRNLQEGFGWERTVTINYGGRTEVHTVNNKGEWIDRNQGSNPPWRGVPVTATRSETI